MMRDLQTETLTRRAWLSYREIAAALALTFAALAFVLAASQGSRQQPESKAAQAPAAPGTAH